MVCPKYAVGKHHFKMIHITNSNGVRCLECRISKVNLRDKVWRVTDIVSGRNFNYINTCRGIADAKGGSDIEAVCSAACYLYGIIINSSGWRYPVIIITDRNITANQPRGVGLKDNQLLETI